MTKEILLNKLREIITKDNKEYIDICTALVKLHYVDPDAFAVPSIDDIRRDYNNVIALFDNVRDPEKLRDLGRAYQVTIEINSMDDRWDNWDNLTEDDVEYVRIESYGNLQYVYFHYSEKKTIMFDVWADEVDAEFITDITIDELPEAYAKGIQWVKERTGR